MNTALYTLKVDFLANWPIEKLEQMTLEEYTNLDKTSFCYWVEAITSDLGSIWGGSSYKFGIFKRRDLESVNYDDKRKSDGDYAWYGKYGDTKEDAFTTIKTIIIKIAKAIQFGNLKAIDAIDLGHAYKWKIAFLYGEYNCLNVFKLDALRVIASNQNINYTNKTPVSEFHQSILALKPKETDYFIYVHDLWKQYEMRLINVKKDFAKWLNINTFESYRAYFGNSTLSIEERLDEINTYFEDIDFFLVDPKKINDLVSTILFLLSKKERSKNPDFVAYDSKHSNGIPKAILGKNNYIKFLKEQYDYTPPNYWLYAPGNNAEHWDAFYKNGIMALGWDEIGDLTQYSSRDAIKEALINSYGGDTDKRNDVTANDDLANKIKIGDVIISKNGRNVLLGYGTVSSNYFFDDHREGYKHCRKVDWKLKGRWEVSHNMITKTLTDITTYNSESSNHEFYYQYLMSTMNEEKTERSALPVIKFPLNQIFYGPPGTGKTYNTINTAIAIANPEFDVNQDRTILKNEYNRLVQDGQVMFTTFHQSMSYEDFVEGIKPVLNQNDKNIAYEIQEGVFKIISNRAKGVQGDIKSGSVNVDFRNCNYFKMSIGGKNRKDVHDWCIANNKVGLGYGENNDLSSLRSKDWNTYKKDFIAKFPDLAEQTTYSITATHRFINTMKKGDVVLVSLGNHIIDAIGVIKGDYEYVESSDIKYHQFRDVEWIATGVDANPSVFVEKGISQQTIYQFDNDDIKIYYLESLLSNKTKPSNHLNYVLIIDEINRGNVSGIFGELITLLESDKRKGNKESLSLTLPYSKESFSVPKNLFIIGTMNTADKSVEALDSALRRRFEFKEMAPRPDLLDGVTVDGIDLKELMNNINSRIEKLIDKDHCIGHSYFLKVKDLEGLKSCFRNNVIPLLEEYFYGDFGKLGLVLGGSFVEKVPTSNFSFSSFNDYDGDVISDLKERPIYIIRDEQFWDFKAI
ncbi:AAA family ATPase [Formosa algae]|uniref:5-methylcytosine-specific restriction endonuclease McrBC GTP-binding regulatory subunit McrB/predicted Mrr-cat superfamily restriction endonuclease n=1 Tax=Formosa algae TaxID=225843 RepID=A0A9X1CCU2_9FLAO|nr:AAA family ATPase [Formosa algae]MBP1840499.1 5-methylcytosine-specific restriction endonuclease McrBC GTP-binding regulatory subunit McrB/predicted Mrr-cat superfamily restriction endonuclease [Formosa algae]MDQ0336088.1 5-methylcytosine-specific restriction endonuclease McrBC GTP-binding regulatory subunit McrB/predicted Mrr-cat superfamily restriction endonuclease [Formosa algae]OEI81030.1 hypothetical protein AST99_05040 [Formosa algae]